MRVAAAIPLSIFMILERIYPKSFGSDLEKCILMGLKALTWIYLLKTSVASLKHRFGTMSMKTGHKKYSPISLALRKFLSRNEISGISLETEYISLDKATDRILAGNIRCPMNIPPFHRSTVDGYAILSSNTRNATRNHQVVLNVIGQVSAGRISSSRISSGKAVAIATGAKLPKGADSVIMIEDVVIEDEGRKIRISDKMHKGSNITPRGNDVKKGQVLLKEGTWLAAADIALIASVGISVI